MTGTLLAVAVPSPTPAAAASPLRTLPMGSDAPSAAALVERVAPGDRTTRPGSVPGATDNIQRHEDVHALPWADAFAMCGRTVPPTVRTRRRTDRPTMVDTVKAIATG